MDRILAKKSIDRNRMSGILVCLGCLSSIIGEKKRAVQYLLSQKSTIRTADKMDTIKYYWIPSRE
jgi:hypothetical protein